MELSDAILSLAMGIGLAAATGLRVFMPLLISGIAFRFGFLPNESASWLGSTTALVGLSLATIFEILAYKIPLVDNFLDALGAPLALAAGGILASEFFVPPNSPGLVTFLGIIAGTGIAGTVHGSTAVVRMASTKSSLGTANPIFSTIELLSSIAVSIGSIVFPVFIGALSLLGAAVLAFVVVKIVRRKMSRNSRSLAIR
jgi:hypothetical protein